MFQGFGLQASKLCKITENMLETCLKRSCSHSDKYQECQRAAHVRTKIWPHLSNFWKTICSNTTNWGVKQAWNIASALGQTYHPPGSMLMRWPNGHGSQSVSWQQAECDHNIECDRDLPRCSRCFAKLCTARFISVGRHQ